MASNHQLNWQAVQWLQNRLTVNAATLTVASNCIFPGVAKPKITTAHIIHSWVSGKNVISGFGKTVMVQPIYLVKACMPKSASYDVVGPIAEKIAEVLDIPEETLDETILPTGQILAIQTIIKEGPSMIDIDKDTGDPYAYMGCHVQIFAQVVDP